MFVVVVVGRRVCVAGFFAVAVEDRRLHLDASDLYTVGDVFETAACVFCIEDVCDASVNRHLVVCVAQVVTQLRGLWGRETVEFDSESLNAFEFDDDGDFFVVHDVTVTKASVEDDTDLPSFFGLGTDTGASDVLTRQDDVFYLVCVRFRFVGVAVVGVTDEQFIASSAGQAHR